MNGLFSVVQIYPRVWLMKLETEGEFPVVRHVAHTVGILAVASGYSAVGYWASIAMEKSLLSLVLAPTLGAACLLTCTQSGLSPAPRFFRRLGLRGAPTQESA